MIERKAQGEDVVQTATEEPTPTKAPDLMAALEESLAAVKGEPLAGGAKKSTVRSRSPRRRRPRRRSPPRSRRARSPPRRAPPPDREARQSREVEVDGRRLALTNLDKVLWPETGFTKGQAIDYYAKVAPAILPHLHGRALTRVRFPNGVAAKHFYEKRAPSHTPDWVRTAPIEMSREGADRLHRLRREGDAHLAGAAGGARAPPLAGPGRGLRQPDRGRVRPRPRRPGRRHRLLPRRAPPAGHVRRARPRVLPEDVGLQGPAGLRAAQLAADYEQTKGFAHAVAQTLEKDDPKRVISKMKKELRKGKVFVDWSQNVRAKTTVAVYSLRAPRPADRVHAAALGRGRGRRRRRRRRGPALRARGRTRARSTSTATCSPRCASSSSGSRGGLRRPAAPRAGGWRGRLRGPRPPGA